MFELQCFVRCNLCIRVQGFRARRISISDYLIDQVKDRLKKESLNHLVSM
jgi:hypothetical protein